MILRRHMFKLVALGAAVLAFALSSPAQAQQPIELKLSHFVPPVHPFHKWVSEWAANIEKESNGRLKFTIYPNGQLVGPPNRQLDAARNAITDIAFSLHGVTPGRYAMTEIANLPFTSPKAGTTPAETAPRMTELAEEYLASEHQGLRILFMTSGSPVVMFSRVPVRSLDDLKGQKVRYSGAQNRQLFQALGAVPMLVAPHESQDSLNKGIIDAALFPYEAGLAYDLTSVAKYAIEPGTATAAFAMVMNPAKYNSLPDDLKALIDKHSVKAAAESFGKYWAESEKRGREILQKRGLEIIVMPEADVAKMKAVSQPIIEQEIEKLEKAGRPARKFYEAYTR